MMPLLFFLLSFVPGAALPAAPAHDLHLSYGRMAVEGNTVVCRIRYFTHDLEKTLQAFHNAPALALAATPEADVHYLAYFNKRFTLTADGTALEAELLASGEEEDAWWYEMQFTAAAPVQALHLTNTLLFDLYDNQRNIFKVMHFPSAATQTLYFTQGATEYTLTF